MDSIGHESDPVYALLPALPGHTAVDKATRLASSWKHSVFVMFLRVHEIMPGGRTAHGQVEAKQARSA